MPEKDTKSKSKADSNPAMTAMSEMQKAGLGSMMWMNTTMMESFADLGSEVLQFIADRIAEDVKTQHQCLHCKDISELQKIQSGFIQKAIEQYTAETGKLVQMSNDMMSAAIAKKT